MFFLSFLKSTLFLLFSVLGQRDIPIRVVSGLCEQGAMGVNISHHTKEKKYGVKGVGLSISGPLDTFWPHLSATTSPHWPSSYPSSRDMLDEALSLCSCCLCLPPRTFPILLFLPASLILHASTQEWPFPPLNSHNPPLTSFAFPARLFVFHECISSTAL